MSNLTWKRVPKWAVVIMLALSALYLLIINI